ncbi:ScbR family autoregulator-binding transcription factor [Streptomyces sp. ODS05-4]|uniref:ScbR family autoregulator-binding transcription factor n=1 Tax=Streptomyces sp. ODS05-4 TaxID=2944939 RepID=UPI00210956E7|nr:ScbR family autoregulator-binding transcription factor [Streptomyces sp. ODS05-4]
MQSRSEHTRRRLVRAGAELFDRNGYAQATLGQIAASAGLTKGALYFHFSSKDGLVEAIEERAQGRLRDFVRRQREQRVPPVQSLIDLTHLLARTLHQDPVVRASFRIAQESAGRQPPGADFHQPYLAEAQALLGRARAEGALRDPHLAEGARALLSATVCGIAVLSATGSGHVEPGPGITGLWDRLLPTLVPAGDLARYRTHPPEDVPDGSPTAPGALDAPTAHDVPGTPDTDPRAA